MIEARFDDLVAGAERAFRLIEPVGVIEARRPGEVAGAIEAAESAASRGLWAAGFVGVRGGAGPRPGAVGPGPGAGRSLRRAPARLVRAVRAHGGGPAARTPSRGADRRHRVAVASDVDRGTYDAAVERIRELIAAGHTYQVNHTIRLRAVIRGDERGFYRDLCLAQRGGYAAFLDLGRYRVLSASPELFLRIDADRITARPMKGTAPRGRWQAEDEEAAARLVSSSKDRAENAMIVDLLRNDLGRICRPGSIEVARMLEAERYETVWQLTSTIEGGPASPDDAARLVPSLVPERIGHGRPQGPHDQDHRRPRGLGPRTVLRRHRLPGAGGIGRAASELQRRHPYGRPRR